MNVDPHRFVEPPRFVWPSVAPLSGSPLPSALLTPLEVFSVQPVPPTELEMAAATKKASLLAKQLEVRAAPPASVQATQPIDTPRRPSQLNVDVDSPKNSSPGSSIYSLSPITPHSRPETPLSAGLAKQLKSINFEDVAKNKRIEELELENESLKQKLEKIQSQKDQDYEKLVSDTHSMSMQCRKTQEERDKIQRSNVLLQVLLRDVKEGLKTRKKSKDDILALFQEYKEDYKVEIPSPS